MSTLDLTRRQRAHQLIPGGCHTYAKGDDQFPAIAPPFLVRGRGCRVWDEAGREYIEYGLGLRSVTLGHAYPSVLAAVREQLELGNNFTRPAPIELDAAEQFLELVPGAQMVKFAKNGSDVTSAAVRLARAYTGRDKVALCADQPFFSVDDWFIGTTPMAAGIPTAIQQLTVRFAYNDLDQVRELFQRHAGEIACLILEPATWCEPHAGYLEGLRALCSKHGTLLIFDEMITGFRWHAGGAQTLFDVEPDLSTFGKGLGNGFSVSALAGRREVMTRGGIDHDQRRVFLLSNTHGAEHTGLAAAIETMRVYQHEDVIGHMHRLGTRLRSEANRIAADHGIGEFFEVLGRPSNLIFATRDAEGERSQWFRTLFMQEIIRRGVIAPSLVLSYSHRDADIDRTLNVIDEALAVYARGLEDGPEKYVEGHSIQPVFREYC